MLDYNHFLEVEDLRLRIRDLEAKVENLRLSRRVLMNILEASERGKRQETEKLARINDRLRRENRRYAQRLMEQNRRILSLQDQIRQLGDEMELIAGLEEPDGRRCGHSIWAKEEMCTEQLLRQLPVTCRRPAFTGKSSGPWA